MPDTRHTHRPAPGAGFVIAFACGLPGLVLAALLVAGGAGWGWALLAWALGGPAALALLALATARQDATLRRSRFPGAVAPAGRALNV